MNRKVILMALLFFSNRSVCVQSPTSATNTPVCTEYPRYSTLDEDAFIDAMLDDGVVTPEVKPITPLVFWLQTIGWKLLHSYWRMCEGARMSAHWTRQQLSAMVTYVKQCKKS